MRNEEQQRRLKLGLAPVESVAVGRVGGEQEWESSKAQNVSARETVQHGAKSRDTLSERTTVTIQFCCKVSISILTYEKQCFRSCFDRVLSVLRCRPLGSKKFYILCLSCPGTTTTTSTARSTRTRWNTTSTINTTSTQTRCRRASGPAHRTSRTRPT